MGILNLILGGATQQQRDYVASLDDAAREESNAAREESTQAARVVEKYGLDLPVPQLGVTGMAEGHFQIAAILKAVADMENSSAGKEEETNTNVFKGTVREAVDMLEKAVAELKETVEEVSDTTTEWEIGVRVLYPESGDTLVCVDMKNDGDTYSGVASELPHITLAIVGRNKNGWFLVEELGGK